MHSLEFRDESILSEDRLAALLTYNGEEVVISGKAIADKQLACFTSGGIKYIPLKELNRVLFHSGGTLSLPSRENIVSQMLAGGTITETAAEWINTAAESFIPRGRAIVQLDAHTITGITFYHEEDFFPTALPYVLIEHPNGQSIAMPQAILLYEQLVGGSYGPSRHFTHDLPGKGMNIAFSKIRSLVTSNGYDKDKDGFPVIIEAKNGEKVDTILDMHSYYCNSWFSMPTDYGRSAFHLQQAKTTATFE
jgi:hypothetical protein